MDKYILEYIWIDKDNHIRSKIKISNTLTPPQWNFDGSSTGQANDIDTEIILKPVKVFRSTSNRKRKIVLCETYNPDGSPALNNNRHDAKLIFDQKLDEEPWYGFEQEYFINYFDNPIVYYYHPEIQGQLNYCSNGLDRAFGRDFAEEHMMMCLDYNLTISGINSEVTPCQWEYQIGPVKGIDAGDQLIVSRFLLYRLSEKYNLTVNLEPKPYEHWNGSGCHTNYSTKSMREDNGLTVILDAVNKLENNHMLHMDVYGQDNDKRMTGIHETASYDTFTWGYGTRSTSIRIGNDVRKNGCGYFEDRRPASNMDPYLVSSIIFKTTCL